MATVDLPGIGVVDRKWVWGGAAVVAAIVGWSYWRKRGTDGPVVVEEGIDGSMPGLVEDGGWGNVPGRSRDSSGDFTRPEVIDTIQEWTDDASAKLALADWEPQFILRTLGKWIAGENLTQPEKELVQAAIAASGLPPGGPYPIKTALPTPTPTPNPAPTPTPTPNPAPAPTHVSVPLEYNIYQWVDDLNRDYPGLGLTFVKLVDQLNPGSRKYIRWDGTGTKTPKYWSGWSGRTPPLGIPPMRIR